MADKSVDACVSWAPDIYNIPERVAGTRILSSTADANKLIADVYAVRADFVRDHPEVVEGLVAGIFEGMDMVKKDPRRALQVDGRRLRHEARRSHGHAQRRPPDQLRRERPVLPQLLQPHQLRADLEERQLRLSRAGPHRRPGRLRPGDGLHRSSRSSQAKGTFADQKDESVADASRPASYKKIQAEAPILTQTIRINFYPNSANPYEPARDELGNAVAGQALRPERGRHAGAGRPAWPGSSPARVILIQGHTDSSMKGRVPVQAVKDLSLARAEAIKQALIDKYKFDPNKFTVEGKGWDEPADPDDPENQALNRRVEISVFPPEQQ